MWPLLLAALTLLTFMLPLLPAILEWRRRRDIRPLPIDGEHTLDVAAVAAGFRSMIERQDDLSFQRGMEHPVSSLRPVAHVTNTFEPTAAQIATGVCAQTLVARGALSLPDGYTFARDIFGQDGICTGRKNRVQALLSDGVIVLREGSELNRWAHARSVRVEPQCQLLGPLCALHAVHIDDDCRFASVSAPVIRFGPAEPIRGGDSRTKGAAQPAPREASATPLEPAEARDGRWLVTHDLRLPADSLYLGDLVVHGNLWLGTGTRIGGSVKASGSIWLQAQVRIDGALVAADAITVGDTCSVAGPMAAEREIAVSAHSVIGAAAQPTTVVAPVLRVQVGAVIHGAVCALEEGRVVSTGVAPTD
ncbi:polymer-forming cytoskeletal protein (plasmid) [Cupriavidus sp. P-10]|uniref:hypothetical protein n=1 Tax=Cupriavidus sp. P-10 TaxID=2027911 RepID=UPI000E2EF41F|nr:hypothetical protein [Cupriavidus sp. P-10]BDB29057.1 polymer-forming cytoskeletal protein [Cupriavidus sp. P-10]